MIQGRVPADWPHYSIGFIDAVRRAYRKAFVVAGRASPSEYWWFVLFTLLAYLGLGIFLMLVQSFAMSTGLDLDIPAGLVIFGGYLAIVVPGFTLTVRRLHDTGRSGWAYLVTLIPFVGSLILLVFVCQGPRSEGARFGPPGGSAGAIGGHAPPGSVWGASVSAAPHAPTGSVWGQADDPAAGPVTTGGPLAASSGGYAPRGGGRVAGIVVVAVVLLAGLSVGLAFVGPSALRDLTISSSVAREGEWVEPVPEPSSTSGTDQSGSSTEPEAEPTYEDQVEEPTYEPDPTDSREPVAALTDPPARTFEGTAIVVRTSDGKACTSHEDEMAYDSYPAATCRTWKKATGMLTGEPLSKGTHTIACQRDLEIANPVFNNTQSNTWWVWAQSANGVWDWFPETAVAQGVSDQSINGIALCEDAS